MDEPARATCAAHGSHRPLNLSTQRHHIWPLGMGGPDEPDNIVTLCPTGHVNVHLLLKALHHGQPLRGGRREIALARLGYRLWTEAGRPGGRVTLAHE